MKKWFMVVVVFCCLGLSRDAYAQLLLEQGKVSLKVRAPQTIADKIVINNTSDQEVPVRAYWEDFEYIAPYDGSKDFKPMGTFPSSLGKMASFAPQEFTLPPFGKKEISYTIRVPSDAQGGYHGVLFFENGNSTVDSNSGLRIVLRVGCLFFIETENSRKQGEVRQISLTRSQLEGVIANTGETILIPQGTFYTMDQDGLVVDRGEISPMYIPPQAQASFSSSIQEDIPAGTYTLILTLDLEGGDTLVKEIDFQKESDSQLTVLKIRD